MVGGLAHISAADKSTRVAEMSGDNGAPDRRHRGNVRFIIPCTVWKIDAVCCQACLAHDAPLLRSAGPRTALDWRSLARPALCTHRACSSGHRRIVQAVKGSAARAAAPRPTLWRLAALWTCLQIFMPLFRVISTSQTGCAGTPGRGEFASRAKDASWASPAAWSCPSAQQ